MPFNKAIIPLYLNSDILNNLFTIVIQEFVEIKSVSTRDQIAVHLKTPMSELSYDLLGKYVQGDLELHLMNEFVKQRTEEKVSAVIVVLKQLRDILMRENLLKYIQEDNGIDLIEEGDFIDFSCELQPNPVLNHVNNLIYDMEMRELFPYDSVDNDETKEDSIDCSKILAFLKDKLQGCKNNNCLRYITNSIGVSQSKFVVPLKGCCMLDNEDYMLNRKVRVMGKVMRVLKRNNKEGDETAISSLQMLNPFSNDINLLSHTIFDYLGQNNFSMLNSKLQNSKLPNLNFDASIVQHGGDLVEILPIVVYV